MDHPTASSLPAILSPLIVAFSGEPGAFAEDAVRAYFGEGIPTLPIGGFRGVFEAVAEGRAVAGGRAVAESRAAAGVVPIENLVNGTVRENYDLLLEFPLEIRGEVVVPVRLCLAALPGESLDGIERVYSHIQALGQADAFLRDRPWTLLTTYNTAGAGKAIADRGERGAAAVLSPRAAALFGLEVLAADVQGDPGNRTRFLVVAAPGSDLPAALPAAVDSSGASRTTLVMGIRNEPGALLRALTVFADHDLNLSKLESRPARERPWEYVFWVDLDADATDLATREALDDLAGVTASVRVLGSYARGAGG
ncbi:MAG: prephenate dehydratase [Chloroflexota bacterium]